MSATLTTTTTTQRLTSSEAEGLWRSWKTGRDVCSRDRLVLAYAPMVRYIASRKVRELPAHCDVEDLRVGRARRAAGGDRSLRSGQGRELRAVRVDARCRGARRRAAQAGLGLALGTARGPTDRAARDSFFARSGTMPTEAELAAELGSTVDDLRTSLEDVDRSDVASLNAPARGTENSLPVEVGETIQSPQGASDPKSSLLGADRNAAMRGAIARLSERERHILALVHVQELPGAEIGRMLGVSESRVSQILAGIRRKLKDQLESYETAAAA